MRCAGRAEGVRSALCTAFPMSIPRTGGGPAVYRVAHST